MLTPRLFQIAMHVNGNVIADIGTDHAYIPIHLIESGRAKRVIACDISEGPSNIARDNINKNNLQEKIEVRTGDGLSVLENGEADVIIIAGMGGEMIENIIRNNIHIAKNAELVLQPMNNQYELRHYLTKNGFKIICEDISVEGFKVYNILIVKSGKGNEFSSDIHYHIPPYLKKHRFYKNLYDKKMREFTKVINGLLNSKECDEEKLKKYKKWKEELENECI